MDACFQENNAWGGPSMLPWGRIGLKQVLWPVFFQDIGPGQGSGITAQRFINQMVLPKIVPFFKECRNTILQQDSALPHTARITQNVLVQNNVQLRVWPLLSPDLILIEHFWDAMQVQLN